MPARASATVRPVTAATFFNSGVLVRSPLPFPLPFPYAVAELLIVEATEDGLFRAVSRTEDCAEFCRPREAPGRAVFGAGLCSLADVEMIGKVPRAGGEATAGELPKFLWES